MMLQFLDKLKSSNSLKIIYRLHQKMSKGNNYEHQIPLDLNRNLPLSTDRNE